MERDDDEDEPINLENVKKKKANYPKELTKEE